MDYHSFELVELKVTHEEPTDLLVLTFEASFVAAFMPGFGLINASIRKFQWIPL